MQQPGVCACRRCDDGHVGDRYGSALGVHHEHGSRRVTRRETSRDCSRSSWYNGCREAGARLAANGSRGRHHGASGQRMESAGHLLDRLRRSAGGARVRARCLPASRQTRAVHRCASLPAGLAAAGRGCARCAHVRNARDDCRGPGQEICRDPADLHRNWNGQSRQRGRRLAVGKPMRTATPAGLRMQSQPSSCCSLHGHHARRAPPPRGHCPRRRMRR